MCRLILDILRAFKANKQDEKEDVPVPPVSPEPTPADPPLTLPYPEEPPDYSKNINNVDINKALENWLSSYKVPVPFWGFWTEKIDIKVDDTISYPAGTWEQDGIRHLACRPEWLNSGVIAHEQAHNSYALLTDEERIMFESTFNALRNNNDPLITLLLQQHPYGTTTPVEGHAECYRYLADKMPESLKQYYPKLF
ncbi:MAG: hypothetical protein WC639_04795 [Patescibacteria group bacterium]|jgi:hypothetical protein